MPLPSSNLCWSFPLARPHCGVTLGNGCFGTLVWGGGRHVRITVNRADFWDRRFGELIAGGVSYARLCAAYDPKHSEKLNSLFRPRPEERPEGWFRSTRLPGGRFDCMLKAGAELERAVLDPMRGVLSVEGRFRGRRVRLRLVMGWARDVLAVEDPGHLIRGVKALPGWRWVAKHLQPFGYASPEILGPGDECGWVQSCPADPALAALCRRVEWGWGISLKTGADAKKALERASGDLQFLESAGLKTLRDDARAGWRDFWRRAPRVRLPAVFYNRFLTYALYKFACATHPAGRVPCGLQGPWVEEYQMPRWAGDYHFNLNVQQIYMLAFPANHTEHLLPLFDMLESNAFQQVMRRHARILTGIGDGLALTHTTNDRGYAVGGVASAGAVLDQASPGWLAHLYWLYFRYTGDVDFLRTRAMPFMSGVMRVYEAMLTERNGRLRLPLGTSPEYRDAAGHTAGPDPSFQLACIHMLARALIEAAGILGHSERPAWRRIRERLPLYSLIGAPNEKRIAVWEGQDLDVCHRHHAHMACIYPFDTLDVISPARRRILENTLDHWVAKGMGEWAEWSFPYAAILEMRMGLNEAPLALLEIWRRVFVNEGMATVYQPMIRGVTFHRRYDIVKPRSNSEVMQLDGTMAAATALYEMLAHTHAGVTHIFAGVPQEWRDISFDELRLPGPLLVGAERRNGLATSVTLRGPQGGRFRVAVAGQQCMRLERRRKTVLVKLPVELTLGRGETVRLRSLA